MVRASFIKPILLGCVSQVSARKPVDPTSFDVVVMSSLPARRHFQQLVSGFVCPEGFIFRAPDGEGGFEISENGCDGWIAFKAAMERGEAMQESKVIPVLSMEKGTGRACAAAFYSDANMNFLDTWYMSRIIRNTGDECRGSGAAILCFMIRHSMNKAAGYSPLIVWPHGVFPEDPDAHWRKHFFKFGCVRQHDFLFVLCHDPNPQQCSPYPDMVADGDPPREISILALFLTSAFAGIMATFATLACRRGAPSACSTAKQSAAEQFGWH
eukprot:gnl/TRDRNA2_/TRDRNA2_27583_c0_seq1.p1 gnl/TRDRNA2_/TRDRNA2_27583_c0~~gnl/TRDRNA2_/TRDRNA2_27583_c0_seq1.p1  ORF type:complete len:269 (+),score=9.74 gnl/TRDRNA2_/TRDRNA2_27583_c0_seq1:146-952(+)